MHPVVDRVESVVTEGADESFYMLEDTSQNKHISKTLGCYCIHNNER